MAIVAVNVAETPTVTDALTAANTGFEQEIENVVDAISVEDSFVPEVERVPDKASAPIQVFALAADQVRVTVLLVRMLVESAVICGAGAFHAVTDTLLVADPPVPVHVRV